MAPIPLEVGRPHALPTGASLQTSAAVLRDALDTLRRREGKELCPFEVEREAAVKIWNYLQARGKFVLEGTRVYFACLDPAEKVLVDIDDLAFRLCLDEIGLNAAEQLTQYVVTQLQVNAARESVKNGGEPPVRATPPLRSANVLPAEDPQLIRLTEAATFYGIPKGTLSKAAHKSPGSLGYLRNVRDGGRRVYLYRDDVLRLEQSRRAIRRHADSLGGGLG